MEILEKPGVEATGRQTSIRLVALASWIGTTIEWYDFYLYGTAAALVFNKLFFPTFSPLIGTLAAFGTFWVGFVARPLGGIVFGHYGDKIGRKSMLVLTLLITGMATFLIGLLPDYHIIGIWAPLLLVSLRFVQGFAVGGEWGGAVLMATEHASGSKRGFYGSWPQMGAPAGLLLSTLAISFASGLLSQGQFLAWGWRVPFLLSILLVGIGLFIRLNITESPEFIRVKETHMEARLPILETLRTSRKNVLLAIGAFLVTSGSFYLFFTFILTYGTTQLELPRSTILNGVLLSAVIFFLTIPAAGALSDRVGRRPVYLAGAAYLGLMAFPLFWLINTRLPGLIALALCMAQFGVGMMYGPQAAFFSELFGTRIRYSGASLSYQLAAALSGGLAPLIATALLYWAGGASWPIAMYIIAMALITCVSVYLAAETRPSKTVEQS